MRPVVRMTALVCNVVLLGITSVVVLTEGVPSRAAYRVLTILMLLVPLVTAIVVGRGGGASPRAPLTSRAAAVCNVVLLTAAGWAVVGQYPYPEGNSVIPYAALTVCTPVLSLMALLRGHDASRLTHTA